MTKLLSELAKGAWSGATAYTVGDIVDNDGSSYICIANSTNNEPPNATYWALLAEKGDQGIQGIQGEQGIQGPAGSGGEITGGTTGNFVSINSSDQIEDSGESPSSFAPALGADDNYVTDAEKTKLSNLSGTNTGDQDLSSYATKTGAEELTNKTLTSPKINENVVLTATATQLNLLTGLTSLPTASGWISYTAVTPTRASADDPTYVLTFSGVDLTSVIYPGMRVKMTQNSATIYAIVTAISFSTNTTLTLYGGTDYDVADTGTYAISNFSYSPVKCPAGFPVTPAKWSVETTDTANNTQGSPTQNTWYNLGNVTQSIPIGVWDVTYMVAGRTSKAGAANFFTTLSTANNTESDIDFTAFAQNDATQDLILSVTRRKTLTLAAKTSYYLNTKTNVASVTTIGNNGNLSKTIIKSICAYL